MRTSPPTAPASERTSAGRTDAGGDAADALLLEALREGDQRAAGVLYQRYQPQLRRYAASLVSREHVDDVVSEAFARMLRAIGNGSGPRDHPVRYLMVVVRTTACSLRTREARRTQLEGRLHVPGMLVGPPDDDGTAALHQAFTALPDRWRQVLWMTEVERLSGQEAADRLGLKPDALYALAMRARKALRAAYLEAIADQAA